MNSDADQKAQLIDSAARGELVVVVGTGVSMSLTNGAVPALSWTGLIQNGFAYGVQKGKITVAQEQSWKDQITSSDLDDLLAAAEFVGRKLNAPYGDLYARWLANVFENAYSTNKLMGTAIQNIQTAGIPICTLNYDTLLEQITELPSIQLGETAKASAWMRRKSMGILHLHGVWNIPESCILGIRDYETSLRDDVRDLIQRSLASFRRLLFIGCGGTFSDPNLSALIWWLRNKMKAASLQHYALVSTDELATRHADPSWHGFVEPISYGADHTHLPLFVAQLFSGSKAEKAAQRTSRATHASVDEGLSVSKRLADLLRDYRAFLLKDCGKMTIEGMRADMDTAQRRFDLERLFVPLKVLASPPDIPEHDPKREEKLRRWEEKNKQPQAFGRVFAENPRLALLALPGGGKTMLLKRLAVAYANPGRRQASSDELPDVDLTPVLIRCREWREHIHRPILTLLHKLPEITGHTSLNGLVDALLPLFKKGRILLLIDGLDEIHDDALRSTFVDHLEAFLDEYKKTRLVVTSREAGFALVAPTLARFCKRWRVAPLEEEAIAALCGHWHGLMSGESPEVRTESREVAEQLLRNQSLHRLAENPLLLTMLLVVKHGAGRLPPDRVSLYSRAVEVLLDTWNIKGHAPLNPKEAVPQLAYVAFELMRAGKQTATERELLALLDDARQNVPQIRRYATDSPHDFLKRVELRSSLLIEAGHQVEGTGAVPFYQFRHLTFQEYLAGVAVTEGHYTGYTKTDTVLTPLTLYLTAEEWKEVVPMAAVLARKQAEPLIAALIIEGNRSRKTIEGYKPPLGEEQHRQRHLGVPVAVSRLLQCFVEEAEATPETLSAALQLLAFFAYGWVYNEHWAILCRGPYGEELFRQAWLLYSPMTWPPETSLRNTCLEFARLRRPQEFWLTNEGQAEINRLLTSQSAEDTAYGLFTCAGLYFDFERNRAPVESRWRIAPSVHALVETFLFQNDIAISVAAAWGWGLARHYEQILSPVTPEVLTALTALFLRSDHPGVEQTAGFALSTSDYIRRGTWSPVLSDLEVEIIRQRASKVTRMGEYSVIGALFIAFHARTVFTDRELVNYLSVAPKTLTGISRQLAFAMLEELGISGQ